MITITKEKRKKLFSKLKINPKTNCWEYNISLRDGYGRVSFKGKRHQAHRFFYEIIIGSIPKWTKKGDLEMDHICENRSCVNPEHLQIVKPKVNVLKGNGPTAINARKTHCIHGHNAFYVIKNRRRCRECRKVFDASEHRKQWRKKRTT